MVLAGKLNERTLDASAIAIATDDADTDGKHNVRRITYDFADWAWQCGARPNHYIISMMAFRSIMCAKHVYLL